MKSPNSTAIFAPLIQRSKELLAECADTLDLASKNRSLGFRVAIMQVFSWIEATCYLLKNTVLENCTEGRWKGRIPLQTYLAALDEVYDIADNGNARVRPKKVPTRGHVVFCLKFVAAYRNIPFDPTKIPQWESFDSALRIRHRLTHPKRVADLNVAITDYTKCVEAIEWFALALENVTGCEHRYPKSKGKVAHDAISAIPIGQAIIFCSKIETNEKGDVRSLLGLYGSIECDKFPATEKVEIFVSVSGLIGENEIQLRIANSDTNRFHVVNTITCKHETLEEVRQLSFANEIRFSRAGTYIFEIHVNNTSVLRKLLYVRQTG
jgi:hypothetical protein